LLVLNIKQSQMHRNEKVQKWEEGKELRKRIDEGF
jgi:hypothetical protein